MPNSTKNIMGAGVPPLTAQQISGTLSDGLIATGNSQATALALQANANVVTTTAASTGVLLPAGTSPGDEVMVANLGASSLAVYPSTGGTIGTGAANASFAVGAGKTGYFIARADGVSWIAILSA